MSRVVPELDRKGLRNFAWMFATLVASLFGVILPWFLQRDWPWEPWVIVAAFFVWGLIAPSTLRPFYRLWIRFGCVMNMIVHGIENFRIERENLHTNPLLVENGKLIKYDQVIANYPFSRDWDSARGEKDPFGRYTFGISGSKGQADYAFIQEMYSHLNEKGRTAIISSQGVLFREKKVP